jgi:hypothetical protein
MRLRHPNMVAPYVPHIAPVDDAGDTVCAAAAALDTVELNRTVGIAPRPAWIMVLSIGGRLPN